MEGKSISVKGKEVFKLPKKSTIIKKEVRTTIEEIENGYLICKSYDIQYANEKGDKEYAYFSKKFYSEDNPVTIDIEPSEEKYLADNFE